MSDIIPNGTQSTTYGTPAVFAVIRPPSGASSAAGGTPLLVLHVGAISTASPISYGKLRVVQEDDPDEVNGSWYAQGRSAGEGGSGNADTGASPARAIRPQHCCTGGSTRAGRVTVIQAGG